jgi:hypothetical protein
MEISHLCKLANMEEHSEEGEWTLGQTENCLRGVLKDR